MYIAMNRFRVLRGQEKRFEDVWLNRDIHLKHVPGFVEFHLVRGPEDDDCTLYASHTVWASRDAFEGWTKSQAFRDAHKNAGEHTGLYEGHPNFEGFQVIQTVT